MKRPRYPARKPSMLIVIVTVVLLIAAASSGVVLGRSLKGTGVRAGLPGSDVSQLEPHATGTPPSPDSTPVSGATPDRSQPDWYIPYLNQERSQPRFQGQIEGIELGATSGPLPDCVNPRPEPDWLGATQGTAFDLHLANLPSRVKLKGLPEVGRCSDDGRVMWTVAQFEVAPGDGVNGVTGVVQISRWEVVRWYRQQFLADRITSSKVGGRAAVFADVGTSTIGQRAVFVVDPEIRGSTMIISSNVDLAYLKTIAEALYR